MYNVYVMRTANDNVRRFKLRRITLAVLILWFLLFWSAAVTGVVMVFEWFLA